MEAINIKIFNILKKDKTKNEKPWLKLYNNMPESLKYYEGSMYEYIKDASVLYPDNYAYEYFGQKTTYKEFIEKINKVAKSLKSLKIKINDRVTICMPNTPEAIIFFYAVNMIGAVANMVHPLSSEDEIELYINKANSKHILTIDIAYEKVKNISKRKKLDKIILVSPSNEMGFIMKKLYSLISKNKKQELTKNTLTWKKFIELSKTYKNKTIVHRKRNDLAVILYSGGTTGKPKGIMLSNGCFNSIALQCKYAVEPKAGESILSAMPIFHGFGLGICIHTPLVLGLKCILEPSPKPRKMNKTISKYKPNFITVVPAMLEVMIKDKKLKNNTLSSVTCILCGGDFLNIDLKTKTEEFFHNHGSNAVVRIGYGLTECTAATCVSQKENYKKKEIGVPFPDNLYKIVKVGTHDEVEYGVVGEICISGPSVMLGYLDDEKETNQTLRTHEDGRIWLHTGDLGSMDEDGITYFESRLKRVIISSGYNIYPSYIEEIINKHPLVETSVVIGIKHEIKNQVAKAIIVLKEKINATKEVRKDIEDYCKKHIAKYALPYVYEYKSVLPRTLVGKVAYYELQNEK